MNAFIYEGGVYVENFILFLIEQMMTSQMKKKYFE